MNKIIIKEAHFLCNVGVLEEERKEKQEILVDVVLFLNVKKAFKKKTAKPFFFSDDIRSTVNYLEVYNLLNKVVNDKEYRLIEAMSEDIAKEVLSNFPVDEVLVRVKKPTALADKNVKYAAVEIRRTKNF